MKVDVIAWYLQIQMLFVQVKVEVRVKKINQKRVKVKRIKKLKNISKKTKKYK